MSLKSWILEIQFPEGKMSLWARLWGGGEHIMDKKTLDTLRSDIPIHLQQDTLAKASAETFLRTARSCLYGMNEGGLLLEIGPGSGHNFPLLTSELESLGIYGYVGVELATTNFQRLRKVVTGMQQDGELSGYQAYWYDSLDEFMEADGIGRIGPGNLIFLNADIMDFLNAVQFRCQFDRVLSTEVMFYIPKPKKLIELLQRVLADGGEFVTTVITQPDTWLLLKAMVKLCLGVWTYNREYWEELGGFYLNEEGDNFTLDMRKTCEVTAKMIQHPDFRREVIRDYGPWSLKLSEPYMKLAKNSWLQQEYLTICFL